jgi:DNA-binding response OmpR family regulator
MNGVELLKRVRQSEPGVRSLLLTGSREEHVRQAASAVPDCDILYKPVDFATLEAHLKGR